MELKMFEYLDKLVLGNKRSQNALPQHQGEAKAAIAVVETLLQRPKTPEVETIDEVAYDQLIQKLQILWNQVLDKILHDARAKLREINTGYKLILELTPERVLVEPVKITLSDSEQEGQKIIFISQPNCHGKNNETIISEDYCWNSNGSFTLTQRVKESEQIICRQDCVILPNTYEPGLIKAPLMESAKQLTILAQSYLEIPYSPKPQEERFF